MESYLPGEETERILMGETALKVWRQYRGLTLADAAALAGLEMDVLADLEDRRRPLDSATSGELAKALDVPPAWIEPEDHER